MAKIKFTREFFTEWQKDPEGTAKKYGLDFKGLGWESYKWDTMKFEQFEGLVKKSRLASFFDWTA